MTMVKSKGSAKKSGKTLKTVTPILSAHAFMDDQVRQVAQADAIFQSLGDGAIATNEDGTISRINKIALDILGLKEKDVLGKWFTKTIVAVNEEGLPIPAIDRPITRAFISGKPVSEQMYYATKYNPKLPVFVTVAPTIVNGKPVGAIELFRDVTKEHEIDRMKSEFISIASHQLRTPLSAINTYSQMLQNGYAGALSDEQQGFMKIIVSSIDRMNELINTLLDISKIESGMLRINQQQINYQELVSSIVREQQVYANNKNIELKLKLPIKPVLVQTDPLLLKEICANFLSNAIKYTPSKGKVTVSLDSQKSRTVLSVCDTGYGIPRESQKYLFSKFYRASNALKKETYGTGLGLYMVKLISDSIGGKVWFKSAEGKGSCFYFALPEIL